MKKFLNFILIWGKPRVRKLLKEQLAPALKKEINAGAIDKKVDEIIDKVIDGFCKKL